MQDAADAEDGMNTDSSLLMIDETRIDLHRELILINKNKVQNVEETERKTGTGIGTGTGTRSNEEQIQRH